MSENTVELSLLQKSYLLAQSLQKTSKELFGILGILILYVSIALVALYHGNVAFPKFFIPYTLIMIAPFAIFIFIKTRRFYFDHREWNNQYLESAYVLIFSTTVPQGKTTGEKIFGIAQMIYPELLPDYATHTPYLLTNIKAYLRGVFRNKSINVLSSKNINYKVSSSYYVDLAFKTPDGYFVVKDFGNVTVQVEQLKELKTKVEHKFRDRYFRPNVLRIICVAKNYGDELMNEESLSKIMKTDLKSGSKIDLLIEEKLGYSVLWVS